MKLMIYQPPCKTQNCLLQVKQNVIPSYLQALHFKQGLDSVPE